tara:strand:+ start:77 stop:1504 length:1428 start_codon:yes stop_codon:yes gene_type:complete
MLLSNLSKTIKILKTYNFIKNHSFNSITYNSRLTNKNTIFIIDKKLNSKKSYIIEAINNKSPAIITNKYYKFIEIPQFVVANLNKETEILLHKIHNKLSYKNIAITGTNGKTSVVWYISKILNLLNYNNSTLGTLGYYKQGKKINNINLTTPQYEELFKYGSSNTKKNNIHIFEASSHAIDQNRLRKYPVNIAALTNISSDHLDYHKNFNNYKNAKLKLFTKNLLKDGFAIINSRIKNIKKLKNNLIKKGVKVIYFGKDNIYFDRHKNKIIFNFNKKKYIINNLKLNSDIELENLECAISCCLALNIDIKKIVNTLPRINNPPGRLQEIIYTKKQSKIIIDYAHTPDALKRILISLKFNNNRPSVLFGCGGLRDKDKRKTMGLIANKYAGRVYITDDNPRTENPNKIRKNILKYCPRGKEISDRKKAILRAIKDIKYKEILIIAGKGHENLQILNNKKIKFSDYKIVKEILNNEY